MERRGATVVVAVLRREGESVVVAMADGGGGEGRGLESE